MNNLSVFSILSYQYQKVMDLYWCALMNQTSKGYGLFSFLFEFYYVQTNTKISRVTQGS
jgi:hypothetical protein